MAANREQQEKIDASWKALAKYWEAHRKEYVENRKEEIKFGKNCYKIEKALKEKAKEIGIHSVDITPDGELLVVVDRHVRVV